MCVGHDKEYRGSSVTTEPLLVLSIMRVSRNYILRESQTTRNVL